MNEALYALSPVGVPMYVWDKYKQEKTAQAKGGNIFQDENVQEQAQSEQSTQNTQSSAQSTSSQDAQDDEFFYNDMQKAARAQSAKERHNIEDFNKQSGALSREQVAKNSAQRLNDKENEAFLAQNGDKITSFEQNEGFVPRFMPTGYKYFDDKMQNGTLNVFDGYIAKSLLDLDLSKHMSVDMNLKANVKSVSATKTFNDLNDTFGTLALGFQAAEDSKEHTGILSGLNRLVSSASGGIWGLNKDAARFATNANQYYFNQAGILAGGGRITLKDREEAKSLFSPQMKDREQYNSHLAQGQEAALNKLDILLQDLEARGQNIPPEYMAIRNYFHAMNTSLRKDPKNFDKKAFDKGYTNAKAINSYINSFGFSNAIKE